MNQNKEDTCLDNLELEQISRADLKLHQISKNKLNPINIESYPFDCIGLLKFTNPKSGMTLNSTAFLISCDIILTSADNIYNKKDQSYFTDFQYISVSLDSQKNSVKIRQFRVNHFYVNSKTRSENLSSCFGLMKLDKPIIKDKYFQIRYNFVEQNKSILVYGFPKPLHQMKLFGKEGTIQKIEDSLFLHSVITQTGQSGSPIFIKQKDTYYLVGIHIGISNKRGVGILLSKQIMTMLCKWQRQMMISQIKFAVYQQQNCQVKTQHYSVSFQKCQMQLNNTLSNWNPLQVRWQVSPQNSDKFQINSNKITRFKKSVFDDRHKQIISLHLLPTNGKYYIEFKVIQYGKILPLDSIYFGLIIQKYKKEDYSDGRSKGSMAYLTSPNNFSSGETGLGTILMDGRQISHGQDLYIKMGGCLRLQIDMSAGQVFWNNGKKLVNLKLSRIFTTNPLYLFISLCKDRSCVSWRSNDIKVWY